MLYRPKVYTASKISQAARWRELSSYSSWSHVDFTARWPYMAHFEEDRTLPPTATDFRNFWYMDRTDVMRSDFVLLFANNPVEDKNLRGGLVEAGIALGCGKHVVVVGLSLDHTWTHSAEVTRLPSLEEARHFFFRYYVNTEEDSGK